MSSLVLRPARDLDAPMASKMAAHNRRMWLRSALLQTFSSWPCLVATLVIFYFARLVVFPKLLFCNVALLALCLLPQSLLAARRILKNCHQPSLGCLALVQRSSEIVGVFSHKAFDSALHISHCDALLGRLTPADLSQFVADLERWSEREGLARVSIELDGASVAALFDLQSVGFLHVRTERLAAFFPGVERHVFHLEKKITEEEL